MDKLSKISLGDFIIAKRYLLCQLERRKIVEVYFALH